MVIGNTKQWKWLEGWSTELILIGGGVLLLDALIHALIAIMPLSGPEALMGILNFALVFTLLRLLGFYLGLADRTPTLAHASTGVTAVAVLGNFVSVVGWVGTLVLPAIPSPSEVQLLPFVPPVTLLGFVLFGIASARTDFPSRMVGILVVLVPIALIVVVWFNSATTILPRAGEIALMYAVVSLVILAIGYRLLTRADLTDRAMSGETTD